MNASPMTLLAIKEVTAVVETNPNFRRTTIKKRFCVITLTMKIVCTGVILYLCLVSSLAWPGSPKPEDDKKELFTKFLQFLAAPKGKCIKFLSQLNYLFYY